MRQKDASYMKAKLRLPSKILCMYKQGGCCSGCKVYFKERAEREISSLLSNDRLSEKIM